MVLLDRIRAPGLSFLPNTVLLLLSVAGFWLTGPTGLHAATISGTIKDPSGAVIAQARIEITGGDLAQPVVFFSDGLGRFMSPELVGQVAIEGSTAFSFDILLPRQPKKVALNAYEDILER